MKGDRNYKYETFKEAKYKYVSYNKYSGQHTLKDLKTGNLESWYVAGKYHPGYGLIYKNTILEFYGTIRLGERI